jgi:hypothetical protein
MYKMDKNFMRAQTHTGAEKDKIFSKEVSIGDRLRESWWITCLAFGIDPAHPPKMDKYFFSVRKHSS